MSGFWLYWLLLALVAVAMFGVPLCILWQRRDDRAFDKHIKAWPYRGDRG